MIRTGRPNDIKTMGDDYKKRHRQNGLSRVYYDSIDII